MRIAGSALKDGPKRMRPTLAIAVSQEKPAEFWRRHHIGRLSLFGSVLRDDFGPDSDIDALAEFEPGCTPGWEVGDIGEEPSAIFGGQRVDMVNPRYLNLRRRDRVLRGAVLQYESPHAA